MDKSKLIKNWSSFEQKYTVNLIHELEILNKTEAHVNTEEKKNI